MRRCGEDSVGQGPAPQHQLVWAIPGPSEWQVVTAWASQSGRPGAHPRSTSVCFVPLLKPCQGSSIIPSSPASPQTRTQKGSSLCPSLPSGLKRLCLRIK